MARWKSFLEETGKTEQGATITVLYTDEETSKCVETYTGVRSRAQLDGIIAARLAQYNDSADFIDTLEKGEYIPSDPKDDELDARVRRLQDALALYGKWHRAIAIGIITEEDENFIKARQAVIEAFAPDLIDYLVG